MLVSALAGGLAVAGCADDSSCGPGDAPNFGLVASSAVIPFHIQGTTAVRLGGT